jgi:hypothetical protein
MSGSPDIRGLWPTRRDDLQGPWHDRDVSRLVMAAALAVAFVALAVAGLALYETREDPGNPTASFLTAGGHPDGFQCVHGTSYTNSFRFEFKLRYDGLTYLCRR